MAPHSNAFPDQNNVDDDFTQNYNQDESISLGKNKPISSKPYRTVTFASFADVQEVPRIKDMTDINRIWFSQNEYYAIQKDNNKTIWAIDCGYPLNEQDQCIGGLESMTGSRIQAKQQQLRSSLNSVLEEQDLQRYEGINDHKLLADIHFAQA